MPEETIWQTYYSENDQVQGLDWKLLKKNSQCHRKTSEKPSEGLDNYYSIPLWKIARKSGSLEAKLKEMRCGFLHNIVYSVLYSRTAVKSEGLSEEIKMKQISDKQICFQFFSIFGRETILEVTL